MGRFIEGLAKESGDEVVLVIDQDNRADLREDQLREADVAIEFTRPESAEGNIRACIVAGVPVVSGTTGWLDGKEQVDQFCREQEGAFFYASNFSIGVNLLFSVNRYLARLMENQDQYDVSIEEVHHTQKLDAPSGTAITLAEGILAGISRKNHWMREEAEKESDLVIRSFRIDEVPGTHTVCWQSAIDRLELKHTAHSREGFARGALMAARWLVGRQGVFGMEDLLGL